MKKALMIICFIIILLSMIFFSLVSPYEFWDSTNTYVNDDVAIVLKTYWIFASLLNIIFIFLNKRNKRILLAHVILAFFGIIKFVSLFIWL